MAGLLENKDISASNVEVEVEVEAELGNKRLTKSSVLLFKYLIPQKSITSVSVLQTCILT